MSTEPLWSGETIATRIKQGGHWRITIKPIEYMSERLDSTRTKWELMEETKVRLRGWDYPHVSPKREDQENGGNYINSWSSYSGHDEFWRLYSSGQFVHLLGFWEDRAEAKASLKKHIEWVLGSSQPSGYTAIEEVVVTTAQVFELAARWAARGLLKSGAQVEINMMAVRGRVLSTYDFSRSLAGPYRIDAGDICLSKVASEEELVSNSKPLALEVAANIFDKYGADFNRRVLKDLQDDVFARAAQY